MDNLLNSIATQVPDLAALIVIVAMFVRALEKRDQVIQAIAKEVKDLALTLSAHATETNDAIEEMHRVVANRKRPRPKPRT